MTPYEVKQWNMRGWCIHPPVNFRLPCDPCRIQLQKTLWLSVGNDYWKEGVVEPQEHWVEA